MVRFWLLRSSAQQASFKGSNSQVVRTNRCDWFPLPARLTAPYDQRTTFIFATWLWGCRWVLQHCVLPGKFQYLHKNELILQRKCGLYSCCCVYSVSAINRRWPHWGQVLTHVSFATEMQNLCMDLFTEYSSNWFSDRPCWPSSNFVGLYLFSEQIELEVTAPETFHAVTIWLSDPWRQTPRDCGVIESVTL